MKTYNLPNENQALSQIDAKPNFLFVILVCMGLAGIEPTREDTLCAEYIKALVEGTPIDLAAGIEECKQGDGAKFFDPNDTIFPEEDFWLSVEADKFDFVLHVEQGEDGFMHTVRK